MPNVLKGIAAPLVIDDIDTDVIIPANKILKIYPGGTAEGLFAGWRYNVKGVPKKDFILNKSAFKKTEILITGNNFGSGSSREQAVWALLNFGIKCIIGVSFSDIFFTNCITNNLILIILSKKEIDKLKNSIINDIKNRVLTIDYLENTIFSNSIIIPFRLDSRFKECLSNKVDEITFTLSMAKEIEEYETKSRLIFPWLDLP